MEPDEPLDPVDVGLFGAQTIVLNPDAIAHFIEQAGLEPEGLLSAILGGAKFIALIVFSGL